MTDKIKYTAGINAKGLDTTGVTEDHARKMAATQGSRTLLIVEVHHGPKVIDEDGNTKVQLIIDTVEPVPAELEDRVREFQRALYRQRPEIAGQETLKGTAEGPTPDQALKDIDATVETDDDGVAVGVWTGDPDEGSSEPAESTETDGPWPGDATFSNKG